MSCDSPPLVGLCKRRVCLAMTSNSFSGLRQWWRRAQRGGHAKKTSVRLKHSLVFPLQILTYLSNYPLIYYQSKESLIQNNWAFSVPVRVKKVPIVSDIEQTIFVPQMYPTRTAKKAISWKPFSWQSSSTRSKPSRQSRFTICEKTGGLLPSRGMLMKWIKPGNLRSGTWPFSV